MTKVMKILKGRKRMKRNYQKELEQILEKEEKGKRLLLHSCCAPCSSYVLEYLSQYFEILVYYYNPNIYPKEEYEYRVEEQKNFIQKFNTLYPVTFMEGEYDPQEFYQAVKGFEDNKEGEQRCYLCYELRLKKAYEVAKEQNCDYFTTTLSISPYKNAQWLNEIGEALGPFKETSSYLVADFKKKNGYKRSVELSKEYGLYRQNYCGCIFSKKEVEAKEKE